MKSLEPLITQLTAFVNHQVGLFFPMPHAQNIEWSDIEAALTRFECCLSHISSKYYNPQSLRIDDFYHSDKYVVFLYFLSNSLYTLGKGAAATQVYYLNKILHSIDLFYEVELPDVFMLTHPLGTVLGRARYSNYFCAYHNCGVGSDKKEGKTYYPSFGQGVLLYGGSRVIGKCRVGNNVIFGANAFILNTDVPDNSVVVGSYPNHRILPNTRDVVRDVFGLSPT